MADFQVIFMDAGQGDCTLIVYPDNTLTLVDCGSTKSRNQAFEQIKIVLERYLSQNNNTINNLVLTHPDEDHYNMIKRIFDPKKWPGGPKVEHIYYGGDIDGYQHKVDKNFTYNFLKNNNAKKPENAINIAPDEKLSRAGVNVTILACNCFPQGTQKAHQPSDLSNMNSLVLLVECGNTMVFLMGDAFTETEELIMLIHTLKNAPWLQKLASTKVRILKMGHHGSTTSTGTHWVQTIKPTILIISAGTRLFSGTGMPSKSYLEAVAQATALEPDTGIEQSFVVFDETKRGVAGQDFVTILPKTKKGLWTTCYEVKWEAANTRWFESGQTLYYGLSPSGGKKTAWYGYTGYEEDEDAGDSMDTGDDT